MSFRSVAGYKKVSLCVAIPVVLLVFLNPSPAITPADAFTSGQTIVTVGEKPGEQRKEVVQISIYPEGFWPTELEQKAGEFLLAINDRTGLPETNLVLKRLSGQHERAVRIPDSAAHWADVIDLPPGRYLLTETSHPDWQCGITVTAR